MNYFLIKDNIQFFEKNNKQKTCDFCKNTFRYVYSFNQKEKSYNVCELCKCIISYNRNVVLRIIILYSKLKQDSIVNKTIEYFHKEGCIPSPHYIDKNVMAINMSTPQMAKLMDNNYKFKKRIIKMGIKYFFTPGCNLDKILIRNVFSSKLSSNEFFWKDDKELNVYQIKEDIGDILNEEKLDETITKSEQKLKNKINYVKNLFIMLENNR